MNQELMLRLFKSIEGEPKDDIVKVASVIIESERQKGHHKLADRLNSILKRNLQSTQSLKGELKTIFGGSVTIPVDKRKNVPLATEIKREDLRHEMILSAEIEAKITRIESEFVARERLAHFGLQPRKRILLYGSPGCGKSMTAERIAWNIGLPFLKVRFEAIISSYLGESATNLTNIFAAVEHFPCVLLLDEFDFIAKARDGKQDVGEMHRVVNILLNVLEDYKGEGIVIATTNLEGTLDKALFRRFDDIIEMPKPGTEEIAKILKATLATIKISKRVSLKSMAEKMDRFSSALIVKIANDAAKLAVIGGRNVIEEADFVNSLKENENYHQ
ncbi:ATP-binding protein [Pedobacter hiemivivus]|uniref:ATP-binding protein n=1 Tax=Pedobacter hiemivivus TaxID=2530454 RepID=A0A4U1GLC9_9SPHI|nr:ATP-binding protein [Pedobacter hiemivivus]TKC65171.1 ATP-binding protein [Pedobacter hiemivivus]